MSRTISPLNRAAREDIVKSCLVSSFVRFTPNVRFGSFATDKFSVSAGECPLCSVSDQIADMPRMTRSAKNGQNRRIHSGHPSDDYLRSSPPCRVCDPAATRDVRRMRAGLTVRASPRPTESRYRRSGIRARRIPARWEDYCWQRPSRRSRRIDR